MNAVQVDILEHVAGLTDKPAGAYNIRVNGKSIGHASTPNATVKLHEGGGGMDVIIKPGTKNETVYIPVVIDSSGTQELVRNDFYIGEDADVLLVAGCGIHNSGEGLSQHDGIHTFHVGKNARVKYVENHYGAGDGNGRRVLNPVTVIHQEENSYVEMETVQIKGVDSTKRVTNADLADNATLIVHEKLMTHGEQFAETEFNVELNGKKCSANVVSRSVAKDSSEQVFLSKINGNEECAGHSECDAIIMDGASVRAIPEITANHVDAQLIHEAAIGKIAGEQIVKLTTLGLSEEEAEEQIVNGFLR